MEINNRGNVEVYCGIDFHKSTSTLCMVDVQGRDVEPVTTVKTSLLLRFLANRKDWKVGVEASGGVNHLVDGLKAQGHEVVIINPNKFRGIGVGGKKTDERDGVPRRPPFLRVKDPPWQLPVWPGSEECTYER